MKSDKVVIEYPSRGRTYYNDVYGVYEYGVYPRNSVNYGMVRRTFLDAFDTLEEAEAAYPKAFQEILPATRSFD
jgi:hypothetical protein